MKKILLLMTMVLTCVGAWAQEQLPSSNKCYHITSKDGNRGAFYAKPGEGYLSHCGGTYGNYLNKDVKADETSPAQQFAFVEYNDKLYLYSVSEKKFAKRDGNFVKLVDSDPDFVTVVQISGEYYNINIQGTNKLNFSGGYTYGVYANYNNDDDGNKLVITEAGSFDPTEALNKLKFGPLESNMSFNWSTSTSWVSWEDANDLPSTVLNDNALGYGIKYIEQEMSVAGARTATVTFRYTSGNCALNIRGVEVVNEEGLIVAGDYHVGKAGGAHENNVYTVSVAEGGTYTVRLYATFGADDRANATNGSITVAFAYPETDKFSHDVTFSAEYATLYLGYKAAIPTGVEAYVVTSTANGWAHLEKVEGVIPANTGVILKNVGGSSTYTFAYTADDADVSGVVADNLLDGTIANRYVCEEAYVLAMVEGEVGFALASLNQLNEGAFLNNANKVYLQTSAVTSAVNALRFNFDGETTAIETVETENANAPIYDLSGRRVLSTVKGGIYIQNGKKFIVK